MLYGFDNLVNKPTSIIHLYTINLCCLLRTNLLEANPKIILIQKDHLLPLKFCFSGSNLNFFLGECTSIKLTRLIISVYHFIHIERTPLYFHSFLWSSFLCNMQVSYWCNSSESSITLFCSPMNSLICVFLLRPAVNDSLWVCIFIRSIY